MRWTKRDSKIEELTRRQRERFTHIEAKYYDLPRFPLGQAIKLAWLYFKDLRRREDQG